MYLKRKNIYLIAKCFHTHINKSVYMKVDDQIWKYTNFFIILFSPYMKINYIVLPRPKPVAPPLDSADTNCPMVEAPPWAFSWNSISATIILSSNTDPQFVHTASPRAGSTSMSEDPQCLHFFPDIFQNTKNST